MSFIYNPKHYPENAGVYRMLSLEGEVIYIGKAKNLRKRLNQYFSNKSDGRFQIEFLVKHTHKVETISTANERDALVLENQLIKREKPKYNIRLKDDKTYPYIRLSNDEFPRVEVSRTKDDKEYAQAVMLFSLFVEHVSLFSQFLIMMSFNKHKNVFKGISNAVEATSKEENLHGMFGIDVINIIRDEHPEWFNAETEAIITQACREAYEAESNMVDWIFEAGELDFLPAANVKEFIKHRFNNSLAAIGMPRIFEVSDALLEETDWFDNEVIATKHVDFFDKRSVNYSKRTASVTSDDLF